MTPTHKIAVRSSTHLANIEYSRNAYCYSPTLLLERAQVLCGHSESLSKLSGRFFSFSPLLQQPPLGNAISVPRALSLEWQLLPARSGFHSQAEPWSG